MDFIERLKIELKEVRQFNGSLFDRIDSLEDFTNLSDFKKLDVVHQDLLNAQLKIMQSTLIRSTKYENMLVHRLKLLEKE